MTLVLNLKSSILGKRLDNVVAFSADLEDFIVTHKDGSHQSIAVTEVKNIQILP